MAFVISNSPCLLRAMNRHNSIVGHFTSKYEDDHSAWRAIIHGDRQHSHETLYYLGIHKKWGDEYNDPDIDGFFSSISWGGETTQFVDTDYVSDPAAITIQDFVDGHVYFRATRRKDSYGAPCGMCGDRIGYEIWHDKIIIMTVDENDEWTNKKCEAVNLLQLELPVPSGRILHGDFIGSFKGEDGFEVGSHNINTHLGRVSAILHNADRNMMAFSVGNSCPGVYKGANGEYVVASGIMASVEDIEDEYYTSPEQAEADGGEYDPDVEKLISKTQQFADQFGGKLERIGCICTDLWWASFMDETLAAEKLEEGGRGEVMEVEPGMYEFSIWSIQSPYSIDDGDYSRVYATFKRVGDV